MLVLAACFNRQRKPLEEGILTQQVTMWDQERLWCRFGRNGRYSAHSQRGWVNLFRQFLHVYNDMILTHYMSSKYDVRLLKSPRHHDRYFVTRAAALQIISFRKRVQLYKSARKLRIIFKSSGATWTTKRKPKGTKLTPWLWCGLLKPIWYHISRLNSDHTKRLCFLKMTESFHAALIDIERGDKRTKTQPCG